MSWWTKNRDKVIPALGLLGLSAIPGVSQAAASAMGGLGGFFGAGGATGATAGAIPTAGLLTESVAPQVTEKMAYAANPFIDSLKGAAGAVNKFAKPIMAANQVMGMAQGPQQPPPPPPPQSQFQPTPVNPAYGMGMDSPPPGIDPKQWAMMTPEQKRRFKGGY